MSRKRAEMNLAELEKLAAMQATDEEIAHWFGVSQKTVQRKKQSSAEFRQILQAGRAKGPFWGHWVARYCKSKARKPR